jgi:hypothetical protein
MNERGLLAGDPRLRRPDLDQSVRWYRDRGVIGTMLWAFGLAALVFAALFFDQLYQFLNGIDLESRYGRCGADAAENCATVTSDRILSVSGQTITVDDGGTRVAVTRTTGAPVSDFPAGSVVETESVGGPIAELKAGGSLLFTQYYKAQDPFYAQWQGAAFGIFGGIWLLLYVWGVLRAGVRSPRAILRDRRRQ